MGKINLNNENQGVGGIFTGNGAGQQNNIGGIQESGGIYTGSGVGQQNNMGGNQEGVPKEDAGSIAGVMQPPIGMGGYVGGFVGGQPQQQEEQQASGYVGGFVGAQQVGGYVSNDLEEVKTGLPAKPSLWTRFKAFLFQEIDLNREITIELTEKEEKVLTEVHDFLFQELSFKGFMNILKIGKDKK